MNWDSRADWVDVGDTVWIDDVEVDDGGNDGTDDGSADGCMDGVDVDDADEDNDGTDDGSEDGSREWIFVGIIDGGAVYKSLA